MHITHCPQCETAFKVSPQQLELAKGWVRCGRCARVFEAALHFETPPDIPTPPVPTAKAPAARAQTTLNPQAAWPFPTASKP